MSTRWPALVATAAFVAALLLTPLVRAGARRWGLLDQRPAVVALIAGVLVLAVVGLYDDRFGLSPFVRLGVQVVAATGFVPVAGAIDRVPLPTPLDVALGPLGPVVSVLWIVER